VRLILDWVGGNAGTLIALAALFVAMHQGYINRVHARKSVRPHLSFELQTQNTYPQIQIFLKNDGIGPAFIKSFSVRLDGVEYITGESPHENLWREVGAELSLPIRWGGGTELEPGEAMKPSSYRSVTLFCLTAEGEVASDFDNSLVTHEMRRIEITLEYESIYSERFTAQFPHARPKEEAKISGIRSDFPPNGK
jgi:hypothetical protein